MRIVVLILVSAMALGVASLAISSSAHAQRAGSQRCVANATWTFYGCRCNAGFTWTETACKKS